jgi:anti-anti-sigma regulatory factor
MKDFVLPEGFATPDLGAVQGFLKEASGSPVQIDASSLRSLDARLVELLLCAAQAWRGAGLPFRLVGLSARHEALLLRLGVSPALLPGSVGA